MKFLLHIECDNAAFEDDPLTEVARILRTEADKMARFWDGNEWDDTLLDLNGNKVGRARVIHEEDAS